MSIVYKIDPFLATTLPGIVIFLIGFYQVKKLN